MSKSISGWETSYFGGYYKVLWDHPDISVPIDLEWKSDSFMMPYTYNKLIKLFLLKVVDLELAPVLTKGLTSKEVSSWGSKAVRHTLSSAAVKATLDTVIKASGELSALFEHYKDDISGTTFYYDVVNNNEGEGPTSGTNDDGEGIIQVALSKVKLKEGGNGMEDGLYEGSVSYHSMPQRSIHQFTANQQSAAGKLVSLLDINFDPKSDHVSSLRTGKLEIHKIAQTQCGNFHVYKRMVEEQTTKPFKVVVLGDESGSMGCDYVINHQKEIFSVLYLAFSAVMSKEDMFFYTHSGADKPQVRIYHEDQIEFEKSIGGMGSDMGENYDGPVIDSIYDRIRSRTQDQILFITISDGQPSGQNYGGSSAIKEMKRIIEKCRRDGFVTCGIGLNYDTVKTIYNYNAVVTDLNELVPKVSSLINRAVKMEFC